jgi:hypothetical protein
MALIFKAEDLAKGTRINYFYNDPENYSKQYFIYF